MIKVFLLKIHTTTFSTKRHQNTSNHNYLKTPTKQFNKKNMIQIPLDKHIIEISDPSSTLHVKHTPSER